MATLLDELVVALRLDPKGFTDGEAKVIESMSRFRTMAATTAKATAADGERSTREYLAVFELQFASINKHLEALAGSSHRAGRSIRDAGLVGAAGMTSLAAAALAAYGAIRAVHGLVQSVGNTAASGAQLGRTAAFAGVSTGWLSAFTQYALSTANVSPETSAGVLTEFQQKRQGFLQSGQYPDEFKALAYFIGLSAEEAANLPLPELLQRVAAHIKADPSGLYIARQAGLGSIAAVLARGPEALQAGIAAHARTSETEEERIALQNLQTAANETLISWEKLERAILTNNPEITKAITALANGLTSIANSKEGLRALATTFEFVFGVLLIASINKFVSAVVTANATLLSTPLGRAVAIGWGLSQLGMFTPPIPHYGPTEEDKKLQDLPTPSGYGPKRWWNPFDWLTGHGPPIYEKKASSAGSMALPSGDRFERSVAFFQDKGLNYEQAVGITSRLYAESHLDPNNINPTSGAYGIGQWLGGRQPAALATGGDFDKQLDLVWSEFTGPEAAAFSKIRSAGGAADTARAMEAFERAGNPAFTESAANLAARYVQAHHAVANNNSVVNNSTSSTVSAPIVVNAPGGDAYKIGSAVQRAISVSLANTGLR